MIYGWVWLIFTCLFLLPIIAFAVYAQSRWISGLFTVVLIAFTLKSSVLVLSLQLELSDGALNYSSLFKAKKPLRLSEIKEVFSYRKADYPLLPRSSFNTKIMYVVVPIDQHPPLIQIDGSWFDAADMRALESFFGNKLPQPLSFDAASKRMLEIRRAAKQSKTQ